MPKKGHDDISFHMSAKAVALLMIAVGFIITICTGDTAATRSVAKGMLDVLGSTLLSAGLVSLLLEISTIKNCVKDAIRDLISGDFPMASLSEDSIQHIYKNVIAARSGEMSYDQIEKSIYCLEPHLFQERKSAYYESHKAKIVVTPLSNIILKKVTTTTELRNKYEEQCSVDYAWGFKRQPDSTPDKIKSKLEIKKFIVNGRDKTETARNKLTLVKSDDIYEKYPLTLKFSWDVGKSEYTKIEFEYEYSVEIDDAVQSFKLMRPCKLFQHEVHIDGANVDDWALAPTAFASFNCSGHPLEKHFTTERMTSKACRISFDEWTLPGAGYVISFFKK